ncbi:MAG TPA: ribosomal L7Ae/L30e/S12e/Gadd45 family protein [Nitrososphaerales archaeon]|nr:ribosomal L7Ae/L30e/S12e/Gadd45 family protein [Nitrososphaerales archaeon]
MIDNQQASKIIREAVKGGKFTIGAREAMASMKGTKAVVLTSSLPASIGSSLRTEAEKNKVAVVQVGLTSMELARLVGRPHRVSTVALRSLSEADLKALTR